MQGEPEVFSSSDLIYDEYGYPMSGREMAAYKAFRWIVADPELLGGKLAVRVRECPPAQSMLAWARIY